MSGGLAHRLNSCLIPDIFSLLKNNAHVLYELLAIHVRCISNTDILAIHMRSISNTHIQFFFKFDLGD